METYIIILLLYWFICTMFCIGMDYQLERISFLTFFAAILIGWVIVPMTLGASFRGNFK